LAASHVVLVHGAWHGAWCWEGVVEELRGRDVTVTAIDLPLTGIQDDVACARAAIEAAAPGCVVVGHSYGGEVISGAAAGLSTVSHLVYLAALMTEPGEDVGPLMTGSAIVGAVRVGEAGVTIDPSRAAEAFYGDSDPDTAAALVARLRPMAPGPMALQSGEAAWQSIPSTYVVCTEDRAVPVAAQRRMATRAGAVVEWPTDHSPFVTRPGEVAELIARYTT